MTIGWDRPMAPPTDYTVIPEAQIAVKSWDDLSEQARVEQTEPSNQRRRLSTPYDRYDRRESNSLVWFADYDALFYQKMKLLDAMEISIIPDDQEFGKKVRFDWDILGYDIDYIWIKLYI